MKKAKFERKGKLITDLQTKKVTDHKFINAAKRVSRSLQLKEDGALGRGSLIL